MSRIYHTIVASLSNTKCVTPKTLFASLKRSSLPDLCCFMLSHTSVGQYCKPGGSTNALGSKQLPFPRVLSEAGYGTCTVSRCFNRVNIYTIHKKNAMVSHLPK